MTPNTPDSDRPDEGSQALLLRYYAGQCDPHEQVRAELLITQLPQEQLFAQAFQEKVVHGSPELTAQDIDAAIHAGQAYAGGGRDSALTTGRRATEVIRSTMVRVGLAAVLCAMGWLGATRAMNTRLDSQSLVYSTDNGHRATIRLSDGSQVTLNVGSRLEVPVDYVTGHRSVQLTGEALFTVAHREGVPFTVTAGTTTTRVLGTRFVVRRYTTDTATLVAVQDGKVAVGKTVVAAQQQVTVGTDGVSPVRATDASRFTFAAGTLSLNNLRLADAIADLNRWYDADIRFGDNTLRARRITGKFSSGSIAELSELLTLTFDVRVVRHGRTLTLYAR